MMNQENGKERNWQHRFNISERQELVRGNFKVYGTQHLVFGREREGKIDLKTEQQMWCIPLKGMRQGFNI